MIYCMFEQSGTFKNEFKKLGFDAMDLDILDEFGETDRQIDLFAEIERGYEGKPSIFDEIGADDMIFAFFPCTRFETFVPLLARAEQMQSKNWDLERKLEHSMRIFGEINSMYQLWVKLWRTCLRGGAETHMREPIHAATYPHPVLSGEAKDNPHR